MRRLHDPTEATRRERARARIRQLSARAGGGRDPVRLTLGLRLGSLLLAGFFLVGGGALVYVGVTRISVAFLATVFAFVGICLLLPGVGFAAVALLPQRLGVPVLAFMMRFVGWLFDGPYY